MQTDAEQAAAKQVVEAMLAAEDAKRALELSSRRRLLLGRLKRDRRWELLGTGLGVVASVLLLPPLEMHSRIAANWIHALPILIGWLLGAHVHTRRRLDAASELLLMTARPEEVAKG